jgi:hypothetical protein
MEGHLRTGSTFVVDLWRVRETKDTDTNRRVRVLGYAKRTRGHDGKKARNEEKRNNDDQAGA